MPLRIKIGIVLTGILAIAVIANAIYRRISPETPEQSPQNQSLEWQIGEGDRLSTKKVPESFIS